MPLFVFKSNQYEIKAPSFPRIGLGALILKMISKESLKTFKKLFKARFREELTDAEALEKATRLVNLFRAIYSPSLSDQSQKLTNENQNKKEQQVSRISA